MFENLLQLHLVEPPNNYTKAGGIIESQVGRTFPNIQMFSSEDSWGTQRLKRVLLAYCIKHPEV